MTDEYDIRFLPSASRDYRRLPRNIQPRIIGAANNLPANPRPFGVIKLREYERAYRIRVGQYRIIYEIDDAQRLISVRYIRHRREVYRSF